MKNLTKRSNPHKSTGMKNFDNVHYPIPQGAPLLCWDIFMDRMHRRLSLAQDAEDLSNYAKSNNWQVNWDFNKILCQQEKVIVVTNMKARIVYASGNMIEMNGYSAASVIGKSPSIFQGPETELVYKKMIGQKIKNAEPFEAIITNYKPYGKKYLCAIEGYPVFNLQGDLVNYIAFEQAA